MTKVTDSDSEVSVVGGGPRDFFLYRDIPIAKAIAGQAICHLVKGWARFMYEDKPTLVQAGDVVHQRPGMAVRSLARHGIYRNRQSDRLQHGRDAVGERPGAAGDAVGVSNHAASGGINACRWMQA
jgi:hypothetical protein